MGSPCPKCGYVWAVATEQQGELAPTPAPLAAALAA
jgi:hypothetical protein